MTPETEPKLWVTDKELVKLLGCGERHGHLLLRSFDADKRSGFPQKQRLWGDRRYLPAVRAYLDKLYVPATMEASPRRAIR